MSRRAKGVLGIGLVVCCAVFGLPAFAGAATLKDSFAGREKVVGVPVEVPGSNVGAMREASEPVPKALAGAGHSVWVEWEANSSGYFTFSACGSSIATVVAVYSGNELSALSEEGSAAESGSSECSSIYNGVTLLAFTGFKYKVLVDGNSFFVPPASPPVTEGALELRIEATPRPPNDDFTAATPIEGTISEEPNGDRRFFADERGYNWNATKETGEPKHAGDQGGASVWYSWTAPESGAAEVSVCCSTAELLGVYTGNAVNSLSAVQSGRKSLEFPVTAGGNYTIAVDSEFVFFLGTPLDGSFNLTVGMGLAPGVRPGDSGSAGPSTGSPPSPGRDVIPPTASIVKAKVRPKAATFSFAGNEAGSRFACKLDARKWTACASPKSYTGLVAGTHTFKVRAVDVSGNVGAPTTKRFSIPAPKHRRK